MARGAAGAFTGAAGTLTADPAARGVPVWDGFVRAWPHWTVLVACLVDLFWLDDGGWLHRWIGYGVGVIVVMRMGWGFIGPRHARFADFVPRPMTLLVYAGSCLRGREPRYLGHNPLGALMILFLLALLLAICLTGWMQGTDRYFGVDWVETTHAWLADTLVVAVLVHAAAGVLASLRHGENLIWAMVTGRKRPL